MHAQRNVLHPCYPSPRNRSHLSPTARRQLHIEIDKTQQEQALREEKLRLIYLLQLALAKGGVLVAVRSEHRGS